MTRQKVSMGKAEPKQALEGDGDFLKPLIQMVVQEVLEGEMSVPVGWLHRAPGPSRDPNGPRVVMPGSPPVTLPGRRHPLRVRTDEKVLGRGGHPRLMSVKASRQGSVFAVAAIAAGNHWNHWGQPLK